MRALKILVAVMGVMILAGVGALVIVVAGRLPPRHAAATSSPPLAAAPIELPAGARIETMAVGSDRLVLDIVLSGGNRQLFIIDLATGRRLGVIPLRGAP